MGLPSFLCSGASIHSEAGLSFAFPEQIIVLDPTACIVEVLSLSHTHTLYCSLICSRSLFRSLSCSLCLSCLVSLTSLGVPSDVKLVLQEWGSIAEAIVSVRVGLFGHPGEHYFLDTPGNIMEPHKTPASTPPFDLCHEQMYDI